MKKIIMFCLALVVIMTSNSAYAGGGRFCDSTIEECPLIEISTNATNIIQWDEVEFNWESINDISCRVWGEIKTSWTFTRKLYQTQKIIFYCNEPNFWSFIQSNAIWVNVKPTFMSGKLTISKEEITKGQKVRVSWNIKNAETCRLNWEEVPAKKSFLDSPQTSTQYYLYCVDGINDLTSFEQVYVIPKEVTANFKVSKTEIFKGQRVRLSWNSRNTTHCNINWKQEASKGSILVKPSHSRSYSLSCRGEWWIKTESFFVKVNPRQVTLNLTATKMTINAGESIRLKWRSTYATSCSVNGISSVKNGSMLVKPTHSRYYSVTCSGDTFKTQKIFINVTPKVSSPTPTTPTPPVVTPTHTHPSINLTTDKVFLKAWEVATLSWNASQGATSCQTDWNNDTKIKSTSRVNPTTSSATFYKVTCEFDNWSTPISATVIVHGN